MRNNMDNDTVSNLITMDKVEDKSTSLSINRNKLDYKSISYIIINKTINLSFFPSPMTI